ncbi:hypothetical protein J6590_072291 [Homalodisca vitripennis]|nr:hypothetical protein J6590_072291 [Homalodisca vitripennis]
MTVWFIECTNLNANNPSRIAEPSADIDGLFNYEYIWYLQAFLPSPPTNFQLQCFVTGDFVRRIFLIGSAARDPHGIKQITVGPPHGIKQITMFIRENVECLDSSFTTTTTIR